MTDVRTAAQGVIDALDAMFQDTVKARRLQADGSYKRKRPAKGEEPLRAPIYLYRETQRAVERLRTVATLGIHLRGSARNPDASTICRRPSVPNTSSSEPVVTRVVRSPGTVWRDVRL